MSKFYSFVWDAMIESSKGKILEEFSSRPSVFVPYEAVSGHESMVKGMFLSRDDVYWHDPTGSVDLAKALLLQHGLINGSNCHLINTLAQVYHGFHDFFVDECRVREIPPFKNYIQIFATVINHCSAFTGCYCSKYLCVLKSRCMPSIVTIFCLVSVVAVGYKLYCFGGDLFELGCGYLFHPQTVG